MISKLSGRLNAFPSAALRNVLPWFNERRQFLSAMLENPSAIGAIAPSSAALARAITDTVRPGAGLVLELGCGTGVFTREIVRRGVWPRELVLVERDAGMCGALREQFPRATVLDTPAQDLAAELAALEPIATTICGLPLLNFSDADTFRILTTAFDAMTEDGSLHLFTYGWRCPVSPVVLDACGLQARRRHFVPLNLPPASVYVLERKSSGSGRDAR